MSKLDSYTATIPHSPPSTFTRRLSRLLISTAAVLGAFYLLSPSPAAAPSQLASSQLANEEPLHLHAPIPLLTLEEEYIDILSKTNFAANWSKEFTKAPHLAGTNLDLVNWQQLKFKEFGLSNVHAESFDVYINYPESNSLKLLGTTNNETLVVYHPTLVEDQLEEDPTTQGDDLVPSFHGYSANGNVTAEYIYANYGTLQDFELLASQGVDINGKIVIVRYGGIFRGLKVKFAQQYGAAGVLIYSEPSDDGEITEDNGYKAYPDGPARNPSSLQRGSVQFLSQIPGDPTTPGWPSKGDHVKRVDPHGSIPKIPSLPISYKEVQPILAQLNGHGIKFDQSKGWDGSLHNVSYNVGPNPHLKLNLYNNQTYNISKLWNVYGEIEGHLKNEVVLLGNHRDAWIKGGAGDPNSGSAVTLEIIRALQHLQTKFGWKPLRTIKFASWDGEEYALLGSTEFGEYYHKELQQKIVAYLNLDDAVAGTQLELEASPLLNHVLNYVARLVPYPKNQTQTLFDHYYGGNDSGKNNSIGILGSGSDFTVFQEHLGIASLNAVFGPGPKDPVYHYHSNYDSFHWMDKFGDPGFVFHNAMAKYFGLVALRVADVGVLELDVAHNAIKISDFFKDAKKHIPEEWLGAKVSSDAIDFKPPHTQEYKEFQHMLFREGIDYEFDNSEFGCRSTKNLQKLFKKTQRAIDDFVEVSVSIEALKTNYTALYQELRDKYSWYNPVGWYHKDELNRKIDRLNNKIKFLDRIFLHYGGLKDRSWFRHMVSSVDRNNGYSAIALPGINEGIEDKNLEEVFKWTALLKAAVQKATNNLGSLH